MPTNLRPKKDKTLLAVLIAVGLASAFAMMIYGAYGVREETPGTHDTTVIRP
jgi:hypothetical protein